MGLPSSTSSQREIFLDIALFCGQILLIDRMGGGVQHPKILQTYFMEAPEHSIFEMGAAVTKNVPLTLEKTTKTLPACPSPIVSLLSPKKTFAHIVTNTDPTLPMCPKP